MKKHLLFVFALSFCNLITAQNFLEPFELFSTKETSYVTMKDGTQHEGTAKSIKRKKGIVKQVKIKTQDGKTLSLKPDQIKDMYLKPSNFMKFATAMENMTNVKKVTRGIDSKHINEGYGYFVSTEVMLGKKKQVLMLQMLNPHFDGNVRVFHDPYAKETMRVGVGAMTVAGGDDKSYFIQVGDKPAFKLRKKDFDDEYKNIFKNCPDIAKLPKKEIKWSKFPEFVFNCNNQE
jgi:hypothetical protein